MTRDELIIQTQDSIRNAIHDYSYASASADAILCGYTDDFIAKFASESIKAKSDLRNLFSKSPNWNEKLDAIVLDCCITHEPDVIIVINNLRCLLCDLDKKGVKHPMFGGYIIIAFFTLTYCYQSISNANKSYSEPTVNKHTYWLKYDFLNETDPDKFNAYRDRITERIIKLFPGAYEPGKKPGKILREICNQLGILDEHKNSPYQHYFAAVSDELTAKTKRTKLFVSLNPAHFLTMSNPKDDERGDTLVSCHSLNEDSKYRAGCTGYALDKVSFIAFTCADPNDNSSLNTRKTSRQMFAYNPYNGLLLQSRMYNTNGGTHGVQAESSVYRNLITRELSMLENKSNDWTVHMSQSAIDKYIITDDKFGGYEDWTYPYFEPRIFIRSGLDNCIEPFTIGHAGMCLHCGDDISSNIYCDSCYGHCQCDYCGRYFSPDDLDLYEIHDTEGAEYYCCDECYKKHCFACSCCHESFTDDCMNTVYGIVHDASCRHLYDTAYEHTAETHVCDDCFDHYYHTCDNCHDAYIYNTLVPIHDEHGNAQYFYCESCAENDAYYCEECGNYFENDITNACPICSQHKSDVLSDNF